jgi:predicted ATPase
MLRIQLFGSFQITDDEQPATRLQSDRLQALLVYLVLHRDQPLSRQQLAVLFWPDTTDAQARTNLRTLLARLREALPDADQFLAIEAQTVQWRSDAPGAVDLIEFEQALAANRLTDAATLYRGDLLPTCYDDWIAGERERLKQEFCAALERLILHLANLGDYRSAIRYTKQLLRSEPLREETYRRLMRLYALSGDRTGVVQIYQTCVRVLKSELDVEPSAETCAVYDESRRTSAPLAHSVIPAERRTSNLPAYLTSFIGRTEELERLTQLFSRHDAATTRTRLITLTGAGGCGKTRLSIKLARRLAESFPDGVWFVDLAPLTNPILIPQAIAAVLGVQEQAERALLDTLTDDLQSKTLLLILDNCEHVVTACAQVVQSLLSAGSHLRILATSREKLNVMGEMAWLVSSLSLPDVNDQTPDLVSRSDAVHLFVERACSALPTFTLNENNTAAIVQICQHLDGIPLAIELAAARISLLTPAQIATRLDDAFHLLTRGNYTTRPHHQTLRATMDWSYQLLSEKERVLFRRLAVFAGGFTLEAVEHVCADQVEPVNIPQFAVLDLLSRLIDKSLVMALDLDPDQMRYRLLEPTAQYAKEKLLESRELEQFQSRHFEFFLNLAEEAEPHHSKADQGAWYDRLTAELDNLRAAIDWSLGRGDATMALRLTTALYGFWSVRGPYQEAVELLTQALAQSDAAISSGARANALLAAGALLLWPDNNWS